MPVLNFTLLIKYGKRVGRATFVLLKGKSLSFPFGFTRRMNNSNLDEGTIYEKIWLPFIYPNTQEWFVIILQVISFLGALAGN